MQNAPRLTQPCRLRPTSVIARAAAWETGRCCAYCCRAQRRSSLCGAATCCSTSRMSRRSADPAGGAVRPSARWLLLSPRPAGFPRHAQRRQLRDDMLPDPVDRHGAAGVRRQAPTATPPRSARSTTRVREIEALSEHIAARHDVCRPPPRRQPSRDNIVPHPAARTSARTRRTPRCDAEPGRRHRSGVAAAIAGRRVRDQPAADRLDPRSAAGGFEVFAHLPVEGGSRVDSPSARDTLPASTRGVRALARHRGRRSGAPQRLGEISESDAAACRDLRSPAGRWPGIRRRARHAALYPALAQLDRAVAAAAIFEREPALRGARGCCRASACASPPRAGPRRQDSRHAGCGVGASMVKIVGRPPARPRQAAPQAGAGRRRWSNARRPDLTDHRHRRGQRRGRRQPDRPRHRPDDRRALLRPERLKPEGGSRPRPAAHCSEGALRAVCRRRWLIAAEPIRRF